VLGIAAFDLRFHEFWRDEANAALLGRAVSWGSLLQAMRYEGVPPLFHVILKIATAVLPGPLALVATGALGLSVLLFGTYRLLLALSGSARSAARATLALSLTYIYAYELGVMVRQYTLGLGLALLSFSHLREAIRTEDVRRVRAGALAAALSALTSAHSACVAGAGLLAFGVVSIARRRPLRTILPLALTLPCFALVAYLASPFPDRIWSANEEVELYPADSIRLSLQALVEGVMPSDWWLVETCLPAPIARAAAALRAASLAGLLGAAALAFTARTRGGRGASAFDAIAVMASWPPLLYIIVHHYWGSFRHHLFLGMPLVVIVAGRALEATGAPLRRSWRRAALALMVPWLFHETALSAGSFALDHRYQFSNTKSAAELLAGGARVVADAEWRSGAMLLWRPDITMRSASWGGRPFRYFRPDNDWHQEVPIPPLVAEECRVAPDRVYFVGFEPALGELTACTRRVEYPRAELDDHPATWETFELFRMDCACVGGVLR
jgi:hypothetical protein